MSVARTITAEKQTTQLVVVPNTRLTPELVKKAKRASQLAAIKAAADKELKAIKKSFVTHFEENGTREGTDAQGNIVVYYSHAEPNTLDQEFLRTNYPKIAAECTWPHPWDSPSFPAFARKVTL
jgi:hypothetical protein